MLRKIVALAPILGLCACAPQLGPGFSEVAPTGGWTHRRLAPNTYLAVGPYATADKNCRLLSVPTIIVTTPPRHGTIRIYRKTDSNVFDRNGPRSQCADVRYNGPTIRFTPTPGYVGPDTFAFRVHFTNGEVRNIGYSLQIGN